MACSERPQERLSRLGAASLSDTELLAMLLRSGGRELDVLGLASTLLARAGSLGALLRWSEEDFRTIPGIGPVKALQLLAVMELARRMLAEGRADALIDSAKAAYRYLYPFARGLEVEKFWVLCLNRKNRLLRPPVEVTSGTATASLIHPREAFRQAIKTGATAIVAAHNHPSGDPSPSQADQKVTQHLKAAAEVVDIELLDHIVVGQSALDPSARGYFSFAESGLL